MDRAFPGIHWENRPSTASPLDEINLNTISNSLSIIDERVISNYNTLQDSVKSITVDETSGLITVYENSDNSYSFNLATRIYNTIAANQQAAQTQFSQISRNFGDVNDMLDAMDLKIDITADTANQGITNLQTIITQNDGYYQQRMTGITEYVDNVAAASGASSDELRDYITSVQSSITQTTQAIQLSVQSVTQAVGDVSDSLDANVSRLEARINVTAGDISLKVSKFEVIDDLQQEFGSGIQITPDRITFASTGAMVVNTQNFKLNEDGDAEFAGHVKMQSGEIAGKPLVTSTADGSELSIDHVNNAWKLRSAVVDDIGTRYYTFLTKNKNFIVSTGHTVGHNADNDTTVECSIGTKNYPWRKGYFKYLRVQEERNGHSYTHDVLPEGLQMTLPASDWTSSDGLFMQTVFVNGITNNMYLYIATEDETNLKLVYKNRIEVDTFDSDEVTFIAETQPAADVDLVLLVEDFIFPNIEGADVSLTFDDDSGTLAAQWSSPDDLSKFITWSQDRIEIQKYNEDTGEWEYAYDYTEYGEDAYADEPLIIGGS